MELFLFWMTGCIAIWIWANKKGRAGFAWFLLALFLSPVLVAIVLAIVDSKTPEAQEKAMMHITHTRCPMCKESIRKDAMKCKHCGSMLTTG